MAQFKARQRKHKVRQREEGRARKLKVQDTNTVEIIPSSDERSQLRKSLISSDTKLSSKKKKRLDKYIDTKLRKEANVALIKKLGEAKIDTSNFKSSKSLSDRVPLKQDLRPLSISISTFSDDESISNDDHFVTNGGTEKDYVTSTALKNGQHQQISTGTGLKRPLKLSSDGKPEISKKRKRRTTRSPDAVEIDQPIESPTTLNVTTELDFEEFGCSPESSEYSSWDGFGSQAGLSSEEESDQIDRPMNPVFRNWSMAYNKTRQISEKPDTVNVQDHAKSENQAFVQMKGVVVERFEETQTARLQLPVVAEEQRIVEAIQHNPVTILCGATGSGKTTQVPQFLLEAGYGNPESPAPGIIGITQPRRIAAVSMAKRVGYELGSHSSMVSYQIRYQTNVGSNTSIKFMTDGILLREVSDDLTLKKYSIIIIDEAHERSVNSDLLIGILSRVVKLRQELSQETPPKAHPLKLVIMSATLELTNFLDNRALFPTVPPIIQVEGSQYPVSIHFSPETKEDYQTEMYEKVVKGHKKLPPGGILVFMTDKKSIAWLIDKLKSEDGQKAFQQRNVTISGADTAFEMDDIDFGTTSDQDDYSASSDSDNGDTVFKGVDKVKEDDYEEFKVDIPQRQALKMHILPLYSLLPIEEQMKVFETPPEGSRLIVVATNVAETSLTIPGIKYVFDCGLAKQSQYDTLRGIQKYEVDYISKASATQRAGRAGREAPGHCYRLYSSAVYQRDFKDFAEPAILNVPLETVVLQLKAMGVKNVPNFPFPTAPEQHALVAAERKLSYLGALSPNGEVTTIGRQISAFPIAPRLARILSVGNQRNCMPYVIALVAGVSTENVLLTEADIGLQRGSGLGKADYDSDAERERSRQLREAHNNFTQKYEDQRCDALRLLAIILAYSASGDKRKFCRSHFVRFKALHECNLLRQQLTSILNANGFYHDKFSEILTDPDSIQLKCLKQILGVGFIDNVAVRGDLAATPPEQTIPRGRSASTVYVPLSVSCPTVDSAANVPQTSVLWSIHPQSRPQYIFYSHLSSVDDRLTIMPLTPIRDTHLRELAIGTPLLTWGKPLASMPIKREVDEKGEKMECWVTPSLKIVGGTLGWPLRQRQVIMRKVPGKGYVVQS